MFKFIPSSVHISLNRKPRSAIIEIPGLSSSLVRKLLLCVSSMSDIDPTQTGEMQHIPPFGVHAIRNLTVLCCLFWPHVDYCIKISDGVSMKTSISSIIACVANFSLKAVGNVAFICSTDGIQSISIKTQCKKYIHPNVNDRSYNLTFSLTFTGVKN